MKKINVYFDTENYGYKSDIHFLLEQLIKNIGVDNRFKFYAYGDWDSNPSAKLVYNLLNIDCVSILSPGISRVKNLADIRMSIDIASHCIEQEVDGIVIASGDIHFVSIVNKLKEKNIEVIIAAVGENTSSYLISCANYYIPVILRRPKGYENCFMFQLVELYRKKVNMADEIKFLNSVLDAIDNSYLENKFRSQGLDFSELMTLLKYCFPKFSPKKYGYKNSTEFVRSALSGTNFCIASRLNKSGDSTIKIFSRHQTPTDFCQLANLPLINVNSADYYLHITEMPENFSIDMLVLTLRSIRPSISKLAEEIQYVQLMEKCGIIQMDDNCYSIKRNNYYKYAIADYIRKKLEANGHDVDENIIKQIVAPLPSEE